MLMSGDKSKIWIVSELYKPSNTSTAHILGQIAEFLSEEYEVLVIAGKSASYNYGINEHNTISFSERIIYIDSPFVRNKALRIIFGLYFSIKTVIYLLKRFNKGDKILAVTNPQMLLLVLPWFFSSDLTFLMHDVFPDNLVKTSRGIAQLIGRLLNPIFNFSYKRLSNAIVLGEDMREVIEQKGVNNICTIRNWADEALEVMPFPSGKIRILYAGNVGPLQGLSEFILWFKQLDDQLFELHIRGEGDAKQELMVAVQELKMKNVFFFGAFRRDEQSDVLAKSHFGLVSLDSKMYGLGVPSKFYNIIKVGRPVLYFGPQHTEVYESIKNDSLGLILDTSIDISEISQKMTMLLQRFSPEFYTNVYDRKYSKFAAKDQFLNYFRFND